MILICGALHLDWSQYFRHAHPGSPYVFGLVGDDQDLDFPEPMPVVGMTEKIFLA